MHVGSDTPNSNNPKASCAHHWHRRLDAVLDTSFQNLQELEQKFWAVGGWSSSKRSGLEDTRAFEKISGVQWYLSRLGDDVRCRGTRQHRVCLTWFFEHTCTRCVRMVGTWARLTIVNGFHGMLHQVPRYCAIYFLYQNRKRSLGKYIYGLVNDLYRFKILLKYVSVGPCRRLFCFLAGVRRHRLIRDWEPHVSVSKCEEIPGVFGSQAVKFMQSQKTAWR